MFCDSNTDQDRTCFETSQYDRNIKLVVIPYDDYFRVKGTQDRQQDTIPD